MRSPASTRSQVKPSIGLTFATAMRAFVRQDPDVIMVGEVRDAETANIAIHAALTGHLVLTTLHTEIGGGGDAASARSRRRRLPAQVDAARGHRAAPGARAVRALQGRDATDRRRPRRRSAPQRAWPQSGRLRPSSRPAASAAAGSATAAATAFSKCSRLKGEAYDLVGPHADANAIDHAARRSGMTTMVDDAVAKCRAGVTSTAEVLRVTTIR